MFTLELSVLLALSALLAIGTLVNAARVALPQVKALRQALDDCDDRHELRFTITEIVVSHNDGKVVPLRSRRAVSLPRPAPGRAAA